MSATVALAELDPISRERVLAQIPEAALTVAEQGSVTLGDSTAIVKYENSEIISDFSAMDVRNIDGLPDAALFARMKDGFRIAAQSLGPLCASFMKRFREAKKSGKDFHGYTDFDLAAEKLTGYSGRQIRNLAAGTPTPPKKVKQVTPTEKQAQHEARRRQDQIDLATARAVAMRNASTPVPQPKEIDAEEINTLLDYILKSIEVGNAPSVTIGNTIYSLAEKIRSRRGAL